MESLTQESKKNSSWAWMVMGIIALLAVFLWIRGMGMNEKQLVDTIENMESVENPEEIVSQESAEILEVELETMDFSEIDADMAELEKME